MVKLRNSRTKIRYGQSAKSPDEVLRSVKTKGWSARSASAFTTAWTGQTFFEAASSNARLTEAPDSGPNQRNGEIEKLRRRSRWMYANDPFYRQACKQVGNNVVHYGIEPNIPEDEPELAGAWAKWVRECDSRGQADFYGLQHMAAVVTARDGEALFRIRQRFPGEMKSGVDFQIQSLEADHLPLDKTEALESGNVVISGVEQDAIERTVAYWLYDFHPKDWLVRNVSASMPKRVSANDIIHLYMPDRFSDTRGYPWGASALNTADRYREYDKVELERKILSSTRGGYYKKPRFAGDEESMFEDDDEEGAIFRPMEPGEYVQVPEGWDIQEAALVPGDSNYAVYRRESLSGLAVAFGWAVELITMNWEKIASDRQYRALMLEIVRWLESIQYHMMIFRMCQPIWERFVSAAYMKGIFKLKPGKTLDDYMNIEWITPKRGYIHPVQDVTAVSMAIEKGLESRKRAVLSNGIRVNQLDKENAEDIARAKDMGLPYSMLGLDKSSGTSILDTIEQYSAGVRAGLITPQLLDEIAARQQAGLPALSADAIANWENLKGVKAPITLAKAETPPLDPSFVIDPETGELEQTDPADLPQEPQF